MQYGGLIKLIFDIVLVLGILYFFLTIDPIIIERISIGSFNDSLFKELTAYNITTIGTLHYQCILIQ